MTGALLSSRRHALPAPPGARRTTKSAAGSGRHSNVTIIRDDWGIPHIHGKTDADAVFGLMYAQAEDDFNRVEMNYLNAMGRLAEAEGETARLPRPAHEAVHRPGQHEGAVRGEPGVAQDPDERLGRRPELLSAHAIPQVKPKVITRFEPWMALTFSEGSIGGDIERVSIPASGRSTGTSPGPGPRRRQRATDGGALGIERLCHRAVKYRRRSRPPADQPPHILLLPRRSAGDER